MGTRLGIGGLPPWSLTVVDDVVVVVTQWVVSSS
jgi:hypothetical protein